METKKRKVAFYTLCHKYAERALRGALSALLQKEHNWEVTIYIMVNTNDMTLYEHVRLLAGNYPVQVVHSYSNGTPGAGRNAVIRHFLHTKNDWLFLIDGDDYLYPYAFHYVEQAYGKEPFDVLGLPSNDAVSTYQMDDGYRKVYMNPELWLVGWGDTQADSTHWGTRKTSDPTKGMYTLDRLIMWRRETLLTNPDLRYPEDMFCYEDMVMDVQLIYLALQGRVRYRHVSLSHLYIYDMTAEGMVYHTLDLVDHQPAFTYHTQPLINKHGAVRMEVPVITLDLHPDWEEGPRAVYLGKTWSLPDIEKYYAKRSFV